MKILPFIEELNKEQKQAAIHVDGPLFVVAGAGTGKTKTLTSRVANLVSLGIPAKQILAITFTNKAAAEMKTRIIDLVGPHATEVWVYTFHAFSLQVLKRFIEKLELGYTKNFSVIDEDDAKSIIRDVIKNMNKKIKDFNVNQLRRNISMHKHFGINKFGDESEIEIYKLYQEQLINNNLLDFDDLIVYLIKLIRGHEEVREYLQYTFQYILVDEFQDTDDLQYEIIKTMAEKHRNIFVVGDPDQSIYGFRGANYQNAKKFLKDFDAETVILNQNYRSTNSILTGANNLIKFNPNRVGDKDLKSDLGWGSEIVISEAFNDRQEANQVASTINYLVNNQGYSYDDFAILYRNNVLSRSFEDALVQSRIPYVIYGGISFYERKEIKDFLAYIRVILNPHQDFYLKRIINYPAREIGDKSVADLLEKQLSDNLESLYEAILRSLSIPKINRFYKIVKTMQEEFKQIDNLTEIIDIIGKHTGYFEKLNKDKEFDERAEERLNNILELKSVLKQHDEILEGNFTEKLNQALDQISLYTSLDTNEFGSSVKLATIHQVKGLEFKVVFVCALEDGIFPSVHSTFDPDELEEERRVAYVAITRAKERLYLSHSTQRLIYGRFENYMRSRFIHEILNQTSTGQTVEHGLRNDAYSVGKKVRHDFFGLGIIVNVDNDLVTIAFKMPHGVKKLQKGHPTIKPVENEE